MPGCGPRSSFRLSGVVRRHDQRAARCFCSNLEVDVPLEPDAVA